ncbi:MAG: retropepsin-like aspartic protease [Rhizomicrobium sp.]|jgi:predicted aspartyl protease
MQASLVLATNPDHTRFFVPVAINGVAKLMLLDTGGAVSELTPEVVQELNLPRHDVGFKIVDVSGNSSRQVALATSFDMDTLQGSNVEFMIGTFQGMFGKETKIAGILAPNVLYFYDVDIDFGTAKLNLMSQDHCEGKVIYWRPSAVAVVPMRVARSHHIVVPVTLDGHQYNALLDTGASDSSLNLTDAEGDFGLKVGGPDMKPVGQLHDKAGSSIYQHTFKSLSFGGISVSNPTMEIVPDLTKGIEARAPPTGTRIPDNDEAQGLPDMLLGMDVLRHLHLYIAYKEQKLYITPSDAPPPAPADAPPAPSPAGPTAGH